MKENKANLSSGFDENDDIGDCEADRLESLFGHLDISDPQTFESALYTYSDMSNTLEDVKEEIECLKTSAASLTKRLETLAQYIEDALDNGDVSKHKAGKFSVTMKKSVASSIVDEKALPQIFMKTKVTNVPNKSAILEYLKRGEVIPGAELITNRKITVKGGENYEG